MKLRSMTGFARLAECLAGIDVLFSIKSLNHRGLDMHFYAGAELDPFENAMRAAVKRSVARGHIDIRVQLNRAGASGPLAIDMPKLDAYVNAFALASHKYQLSTPLDLNAALRIPGILSEAPILQLPDNFEAPFIALLDRALQSLNEFREREGGEIAAILVERAVSIQQIADEIAVCRKGAMPGFHARLRDRLSELLAGSNVDSQRLIQESALLADRSDVSEEIDRLRIHSGQVRDLLQKGNEVGKKLDFLLQEMNRETNTILSKTSGLGDHGMRITELAIGARSDIEKMREQVLNLE